MPCPCAPGGSFRSAIAADLDRAVVHLGSSAGSARRRPGPLAVLKVLVVFPGFVAVLAYRLGHWFVTRFPGGRLLMWLPTRVMGLVLGIELDPQMHVGHGFFINHYGGIFVTTRGMGDNVNLAQGVTIGRPGRFDAAEDDSPLIGDRVWIGPHAVVVGRISVGDDAVVGANSVVSKDVAPAGVALGNPARVLSWRGSFTQVLYRGMDHDPVRATALRAVEDGERGGAGATGRADRPAPPAAPAPQAPPPPRSGSAVG